MQHFTVEAVRLSTEKKQGGDKIEREEVRSLQRKSNHGEATKRESKENSPSQVVSLACVFLKFLGKINTSIVSYVAPPFFALTGCEERQLQDVDERHQKVMFTFFFHCI